MHVVLFEGGCLIFLGADGLGLRTDRDGTKRLTPRGPLSPAGLRRGAKPAGARCQGGFASLACCVGSPRLMNPQEKYGRLHASRWRGLHILAVLRLRIGPETHESEPHHVQDVLLWLIRCPSCFHTFVHIFLRASQLLHAQSRRRIANCAATIGPGRWQGCPSTCFAPCP